MSRFDDYFGPNAFSELGQQEEESYEDRVVCFLLDVFKLTKQKDMLLERCRQQGFPRLRLSVFCDEYSEFPLRLGADRLDGVKLYSDKRAMIPALYSKFSDAPFVKAFEKFVSGLPKDKDRRHGLVFPRKGIVRGLIIHDGYDLDARLFAGTVMTHTDKEGNRLFVQSFAKFVGNLYNDGHGLRLK